MPYRMLCKGLAEAACKAASAKPLHNIRYGIEDNLRTGAGSKLKTSYVFGDLSFLPPELQSETWTRYRLIEPLVKRPWRKRKRKDVETRIREFFHNQEYLEQLEEQPFQLGKRVGKGKKQTPEPGAGLSVGPGAQKQSRHGSTEGHLEIPHPSTVYRWIRRWERSGGDIRSLVPTYHARGPQEPYGRNSFAPSFIIVLSPLPDCTPSRFMLRN